MNYDNLDEIFSAGIANMTCLFENSNSYDDGTYVINGADYFSFNGSNVLNVYAHGNSYWGIGTDTENLKVNNRDTRMRSLYREEGTLYSYYKFLKIRWEGWSQYNSSGLDYQLKYDIILWNTGDISLHMVSIPAQCYNGSFEFIADKTYLYNKPTVDLPDVTFKYNKETNTFNIEYAPINLVVPFKLLIKDSSGKIYTIANKVINEETGDTEDVLVKLEDREIRSSLFKTKGFNQMPKWNLIKELNVPQVLSWSDTRAFPLNAIITGTPPKQCVECTADLSDSTVLGIKALNADYTGIITEQHSFDGENFTDEIAMADFLMSDLEALYDGLTESKIITFRFWLSGDATLKTFIMNYRNGDDNDEK